MAPEIKLLHAYANCTNGLEIEKTLLNFEILFPGKSFRTRRGGGKKYFHSQESLEYYLNDYPRGNPFVIEERMKEDFSVSTDKNYDELMPHVAVMKNFLEDVMIKPVGLLNLPQEIFKNAVATNVISSLPIPDDGWHYRIGLTQPIQENVPLEDLIEIFGILLPLHDPYSDVRFEYTKKCAVCGKYYQAKGQKAIYCSERCRGQARNKKKKEEKRGKK